jgi:hypothetical protein
MSDDARWVRVRTDEAARRILAEGVKAKLMERIQPQMEAMLVQQRALLALAKREEASRGG